MIFLKDTSDLMQTRYDPNDLRDNKVGVYVLATVEQLMSKNEFGEHHEKRKRVWIARRVPVAWPSIGICRS
jgi:hypothetical protein